VLTLLDPNGVAVDYESCRVGFRRIELSPDGVILLNGKRLVVRGVNRHEHHPDTGRTISAVRMREEIVKIKQLNFNAVRTSHYPNDPLWYELCDELGLYLVDETNLESHGMQCTLSKDPEWALAYLERVMRVALRDKNHPSILFWSLGNESGAGANHAAMAGWIRYYDPYRLVQYESGNPGPLISDIRVPMYPSLSWVEDVMADMRDKRPMIMCEYAYSKSNSNGNFFKFWEMVDKYPRFQGGFVWDWSDKAIRITAEDGTFTWGYGGDFGESVVDRVPDMCLNGVVSPDLEPHPGAFEIKKLQAPVAIIPVDARAGRFIVKNKHAFSDLSHLMLKWQLIEDGLDILASTMFLPDTMPGEQNSFTVPFEFSEGKAGSEYFINLSLCLQSETAWAPAGFELYAEQAELPASVQTADVLQEVVRVPQASELSVTRKEGELTVHGAGFNVEFDLREGIISSYVFKGKPLLLNGAMENYFRAPTGIDSAQGTRFFYGGEWQSYGLARLVRDIRSVQVMASNAESVVVEAESFLHPAEATTGFRSIVTYTVRGDGSIEVRNRVDAFPELALLPRIGLSFTVPATLGGLQWYGRGPHENYADRKRSAHIGLYRSYVDEQPCPYIVPVEHGGREDVRWFALTDSEGSGLKFEGFVPFHMDVHRNSVEDYKTAKHAEELLDRDRIWVNIDHVHSGLGGDTGWSRNIHEEYQVKPGRYEFSFTIRPVV
jgi:beta-galactosidase